MDPIINFLRGEVKQVFEEILWYLSKQPSRSSAQRWCFREKLSSAGHTIDGRWSEGNTTGLSFTRSSMVNTSGRFWENAVKGSRLELLEKPSVEKVYYALRHSLGPSESSLLVDNNRWIPTWYMHASTTWSTIRCPMPADSQLLENIWITPWYRVFFSILIQESSLGSPGSQKFMDIDERNTYSCTYAHPTQWSSWDVRP